VQKKMSS